MNVQPGTTIGRYEIVSFIGAGGMGQVFRARDAQLGRDVAIKILPATWADKAHVVTRFQQEARALGHLNHPNLVTVYDFGTHEESFYIVLELLVGETLRERLRRGPLPQRRAVQYAVQIANGMAAAHERGIIHRDLKPENIFLTNEGRLKILDFGLAKMTPAFEALAASDDSPTAVGMTLPGMVMGTVGYMAPEQLRGEVVDHRADIFAFGAILYEMLAGVPPFDATSPAETMSSVLKDDPAPLRELGIKVTHGFELIIDRCLDKRPENRFQTAHDLSLALEAVGGATDAMSLPIAIWKKKARRLVPALAIAAALLLAGLAGAFVWQKTKPQEPPVYRQLTFRRGDVSAARFAPDGSILYSASWEGRGYELYTMRPDSVDARPLGTKARELFAISRKGDLALLTTANTLAIATISGGAPREVAKSVQTADWSPDGSKLAVAGPSEGGYRIEYPAGTVVYRTPTRIRDVRVSPDGARLAFRLRAGRLGKRYAVAVLDVASKKIQILGEWLEAKGLAWSMDGTHVLFAASNDVGATEVREVSLDGDARLVERFDGNVKLHDVSPRGDLLLTRDDYREDIMARAPGSESERNLAWLDASGASDISPDGRTLLMTEFGASAGSKYSVYIRSTNGDPAVRLGDGYGVSLSPDGASALTIVPGEPSHLAIVPVGPGSTRVLPNGPLVDYEFGSWMPDGKSVVFTGRTATTPMHLYRQSLAGGAPQPIGEPGMRLALASRPVSPDGQWLGVVDGDGRTVLLSLTGAPPRALASGGVHPVTWSPDSRTLYVVRDNAAPSMIERIEIATGKREPVRELMPADPAGVHRVMDVVVTPDGNAYAYGVLRNLSTLFIRAAEAGR